MTAVLSTPTLGFSVEVAYAEYQVHWGKTSVLLHEIEGLVVTACAVPVGPYADVRDRALHPVEVTDWRHVKWCGSCWVGHRRCVVCRAPSGDSCECATHIRESIEADTRLRRAA